MPIENFGRATWPRPVEADRTGGGVSATPYWAPREEDDLKAAEAQWRQALQRLPVSRWSSWRCRSLPS